MSTNRNLSLNFPCVSMQVCQVCCGDITGVPVWFELAVFNVLTMGSNLIRVNTTSDGRHQTVLKFVCQKRPVENFRSIFRAHLVPVHTNRFCTHCSKRVLVFSHPQSAAPGVKIEGSCATSSADCSIPRSSIVICS